MAVDVVDKVQHSLLRLNRLQTKVRFDPSLTGFLRADPAEYVRLIDAMEKARAFDQDL